LPVVVDSDFDFGGLILLDMGPSGVSGPWLAILASNSDNLPSEKGKATPF